MTLVVECRWSSMTNHFFAFHLLEAELLSHYTRDVFSESLWYEICWSIHFGLVRRRWCEWSFAAKLNDPFYVILQQDVSAIRDDDVVFQQVHVEDNKSADWWQVPALLGRCRNWSKEQVLLPVWDMLIRIVPAVPYLVILIGMDNQMFGWSYALLWAHDLPTEELIDASICGMSPNGIWLRLPSRAGDEGQDFRTLLRAEHCKAPWTFVQSL